MRCSGNVIAGVAVARPAASLQVPASKERELLPNGVESTATLTELPLDRRSEINTIGVRDD
jgi:hypothetical protein